MSGALLRGGLCPDLWQLQRLDPARDVRAEQVSEEGCLMLLHDRATIVITKPAYDGWGQPIPGGERVEHVVPAEVQPINADANLEQHTNLSIAVTRFRVIVQPTDVDLTEATEILWGDYELSTDGAVQPHVLRGRVHHLEFVARFEKYRRP